MFLCTLCAEVNGTNGILRSWGTCEVCGDGRVTCFDIPAAQLPSHLRTVEDTIALCTEELFGLARERRLLAATQEVDELACQDETLDRAIEAIPAGVRPLLIRHLVIAMDAVSHSYQEARIRR